MNMKVVLFVALSLVILGVPASFARPEFVSSLNAVYGVSSCGTCHIDPNGGGPRNAYGILFENQFNLSANVTAALIAIGPPPNANPTVMATATPAAPLVATETAVATETPATTVATETPATTVATETPVPPVVTATPATPGFEIVLSLIGLFACFLAKRKNK
jgi:hypothetical protein